MRSFLPILSLLLVVMFATCNRPNKPLRNDSGRIEILFLGHDSEHHNSALYMPLLASQLSLEGINFTYTDKLEDINDANLANYDALINYANHDSIKQDQE